MTDLKSLGWSFERLAHGIEALGQHSSLIDKAATKITDVYTPPDTPTGDALDRWLVGITSLFQLEAESLRLTYSTIEQTLARRQPLIIALPDGSGFLLVVSASRRTLTILKPDGTRQRLAMEALASALRKPLEGKIRPDIHQMLEQAGIAETRRSQAETAMLHERLAHLPIQGCWQITLAPGSRFRKQILRAQLPQQMIGAVIAYTGYQILYLASWWLLGQQSFEESTTPGWFAIWGLLLMALIPMKMIFSWLQAVIQIDGINLLERRLFQGGLSLKPDEIRHQAIGELLGQVIESENLDLVLRIGGGLRSVIGFIELITALTVLAAGAGGLLHAGLAVATLIACLAITYIFYQRHGHWTTMRRKLTHELVEQMIGYRTRLAQERPERWHIDEDAGLAAYYPLSQRRDFVILLLEIVIPRTWLLIGMLGLIPALMAGTSSAEQIALSIGGMLISHQAFLKIVPGLFAFVEAYVSWKQVTLLFEAPTRHKPIQSANLPDADAPLLEADSLSFRYHEHSRMVLNECNLRISDGDRLLLEGPSGSGKTTFTTLLSGLRTPISGQINIHGMDSAELDIENRRRSVIMVPQFHENHIFTQSLAFNLLMGRQWPPTQEDVQEAEAICAELGLDDLVSRMPAGLDQMVGEMGWQLSHGERSRVYIARALLQNPDLIILDESFAALDPENLHRSLDCALNHAATLLVISHP